MSTNNCIHCTGNELLDHHAAELVFKNGDLSLTVDGFTTTVELNYCPACGKEFNHDPSSFIEEEKYLYLTQKREDLRSFRITKESYFISIEYSGGGYLGYKIPRKYCGMSGREL